jgi:hypothetical protein
VRVQSFAFNGGVPDGIFQFEIPEDAHVMDIEDMKPTPLTLDEAEVQAEFDLLVPTYEPDDATLIEVFQVGEAFVLRYDHSATSFTIVQGDLPHAEGDLPEEAHSGEIADVDVRGQEATLATDGAGNSFLTWTEDGVNITIAGHISADEIVKVAESME